jgi:hypothetical protein
MLWSAALQVVFFSLLRQKLIDPIILHFNIVFKHFFFKKDQRVHFAEELIAPGIIAFEPKVLALDFVLKIRYVCVSTIL